jgi:hypothetical protein
MKGMIRSLARNPFAQPVRKLSIPVRNVALAIAGTTGVGFGSVVIGDLPPGNILFLGAVAYMQFTTADGDVVATYDGDYAIGSTPTADATVTGTDADIVALTALGAATAGVSPVARGTNATQVILDNTDGSLELNLNVLIDDANISGTGDFLVSGVLHIAFTVLGDD